MPQGSVLGLPFCKFYHDIDKGHSCRLVKFADDTKLYGLVSSVEEVDKIRKDLVKLSSWSAEWLMLYCFLTLINAKFYISAKNNNKSNYEIGGKNLRLFGRRMRLRCQYTFRS